MSAATPAITGRPAAPGDRRWPILVVVAIAQLMVVLDSTIVHIACRRRSARWGSPTATGNGWVTAYALAFGSLLLAAPWA